MKLARLNSLNPFRRRNRWDESEEDAEEAGIVEDEGVSDEENNEGDGEITQMSLEI